VSAASAIDAALLTMAHRDERTPCQGWDADLFLSEDHTERAAAIPLCAGCALFDACRVLADELNVTFGVWAGVDRGPRHYTRARTT
jgi:Transcription factor WhiB